MMRNHDLCEGFAERYDRVPGRREEYGPIMVRAFLQIFSEHGDS